MLNRSKDIEGQFWSAYARQIWQLVKWLSQDACYGCSHRSSIDSDHKICQLDDGELISCFVEKADALTDLNGIVEEWKTSLSQMTLSIEDYELAPCDEQWIMSQFILPNRHEILLSLMSGDVNHTPNVTWEMGTEGQFIPLVVPSIGEQEWMSVLSDLGLEFIRDANLWRSEIWRFFFFSTPASTYPHPLPKKKAMTLIPIKSISPSKKIDLGLPMFT